MAHGAIIFSSRFSMTIRAPVNGPIPEGLGELVFRAGGSYERTRPSGGPRASGANRAIKEQAPADEQDSATPRGIGYGAGSFAVIARACR